MAQSFEQPVTIKVRERHLAFAAEYQRIAAYYSSVARHHYLIIETTHMRCVVEQYQIKAAQYYALARAAYYEGVQR